MGVTAWAERRVRDARERGIAVPLGLVALGAALGAGRLLRLGYGDATFGYDLGLVWLPLAENVLGGADLYGARAADNKPPLFEFVVLATALLGDHAAALVMATNLANGVVAALTWRLARDRGGGQVGVLAGGLYLSALPLVDGTAVNVRTFALLGILGALLAAGARRRGAGIALGALCSQYALLAAPIALWDGVGRSDRSPIGYAIRFAAAFAVVVAAAFAAVGLLWGPDALVGAVYWSTGLDLGAAGGSPPHGYAVNEHVRPPGQYAARPTLLVEPGLYAGYVGHTASVLGYLLVPAGYAAVGAVRSRSRDLDALTLVAALVLGSTLLVRHYYYYWVLVLPFLALLAARGYGQLLGGDVTAR